MVEEEPHSRTEEQSETEPQAGSNQSPPQPQQQAQQQPPQGQSPQQGQPPQGQAPAGERRRQPPRTARDSLGDINSRPDTMQAVKNYGGAMVGAGLAVGVVGLVSATSFDSGSGGGFGVAFISIIFGLFGTLGVPLLGAPAGTLTVRQIRRHRIENYVDPTGQQIVGAAALAGVLGAGVGSFLALTLTLVGFGATGSLGDLLLPVIGAAAAGGIAAAAGAYTEQNFGVP